MISKDLFSNPENRNKMALWLSVILFVGIVVWMIIASYVPAGSVRVSVALFPSDATLTIDGKKFGNNQAINLTIGDHEVSVERDGFESHTDKLIMSQDDKYITYILEAQNAEAEQWVADHQDEYDAVYAKAEEQNMIDSDSYAENNPILNVLPYDDGTYAIGTLIGVDPIVVSIDAGVGYRNAAIRQIYDLGFNPANYTIQFENYTNPFKEYE